MTHSISDTTKSPVAVKLVVSYWLTATMVSLIAVLVYDPSANVSRLAFVPLLPLLPLFTLVALANTPPVNPLPLSLMLASLLYPTVFIALAKVTRLFRTSPITVGILGGLSNGALTAVCFRAMVYSL